MPNCATVQSDSHIRHRVQLRQDIENKLKLPVIITRAGTVFVLDLLGKDARVLPTDYMSERNGLTDIGISQSRKPLVKRYPIPVRLFLRYPEVSVEAAEAALKKLSSAVTKSKPSRVHIILDTGPSVFDWERLQQFVSAVLSLLGKSQISAGITIEGVFSCPSGHIMDWLVQRRIIARYILGRALGYPGDIDTATAKTLRTASEYGLRIPVLLYWSGQSENVVAELLKKALRLNKLAGAGVLPYFLSPRFDGRNISADANLRRFSDVLAFSYSDRLLSEFIDEPIGDIEGRLANSFGARCIRGLITETGDILSFRRFPFAATPPQPKKSSRRTISPALSFNVPMHGRCRRCAWRHICGGVDRAPEVFRQQHKIIMDAWCLYEKLFMQQIVGECLEIREHLSQVKDRLLKDAS